MAKTEKILSGVIFSEKELQLHTKLKDILLTLIMALFLAVIFFSWSVISEKGNDV